MTMEKESKKGQNAAMLWLSDAMSSHPSSDQRVTQADEMRHIIQTSGGIDVTPDFLRMKKVAADLIEKYKKK
jgi:hypothetical protein